MPVRARTPSLGWKMQVNASAATVGEIYIYDDIAAYESWWDEGGALTPKRFKEDLDALGPNITLLNVYINSNGGDVFAGQAMHSMLSRHQAEVHVYVDGLAASIASVIAMAGDKVIMPSNAMMMIHNPWTMIWDIPMGNEDEFRQWAERCLKTADNLNKIRESCIAAYMKRCTCSQEELVAMLDAETWLSADDCKQYGFCDEIEGAKKVAASLSGRTLVMNGREFDLSVFRHTPKLEAHTNLVPEPQRATVQAPALVAMTNGSTEQRTPTVAPLSLFERELRMNERRLGR